MVRPEYISGEYSQPNTSGLPTAFGVGGDTCVNVAILLENVEVRYGRSPFWRKSQTALGVVVVGNDFMCSEFFLG